MSDSIFERFIKESPISVMARATAERALNPEKTDQWFDNLPKEQYTKDLLFSSMFGLMSKTVTGSYPSVHAAYQKSKEEIGVSVTSVYNKLNGIEIDTSAELVRYAAGELAPAIIELGGATAPLLPGYRVKMLDGNCIEASEHRIAELRELAAGALPGKSLVVYDPVLRMPIDVFPCEDGHAQERSLLGDVSATAEKNDVWAADRNFCTCGFITEIADSGAFFIIRLHRGLSYEIIGVEKAVGLTETGEVSEQFIAVTDASGKRHIFRRIRVHLVTETRDGDIEIFIITNQPPEAASAVKIADIYRKRWKIETSFQELEDYSHSEINTLGYPPAALFAFCVALISYMILAVVKAALAGVHGVEKIEEEVSGFYICDVIAGVYRGMMIALPDEDWKVFRDYLQSEFIALLLRLSENVKISAFRKHPRGPKKKPPKRKSDPKVPHVSTAKLIAMR